MPILILLKMLKKKETWTLQCYSNRLLKLKLNTEKDIKKCLNELKMVLYLNVKNL